MSTQPFRRQRVQVLVNGSSYQTPGRPHFLQRLGAGGLALANQVTQRKGPVPASGKPDLLAMLLIAQVTDDEPSPSIGSNRWQASSSVIPSRSGRFKRKRRSGQSATTLRRRPHSDLGWTRPFTRRCVLVALDPLLQHAYRANPAGTNHPQPARPPLYVHPWTITKHPAGARPI